MKLNWQSDAAAGAATSLAARPREGRRQLRAAFRFEWLAVPAAAVAAWQGLAWHAGPAFLPGPVQAVARAAQGLRQGWLLQDLGVTGLELLWGFVWAAVLGLAVGAALGSSPLLRAAYEGPLLSLYSIPKVTLFPIFLFAFKLGMESKIAFGAFHGLFPIAIYTWTAMSTVRPVYFKVARALGLSRAATFRAIVLPAVVPAVATGLRVGLNLTFLGVLIGEMFASRAGLGFLLMSFGAAFDMNQILAVLVIVFAAALSLNVPFLIMERRLGRWAEEMSLAGPAGRGEDAPRPR